LVHWLSVVQTPPPVPTDPSRQYFCVLPVRKTYEASGNVMAEVPATLSTEPLASERNTFRMQVEVGPAGTGSGVPNRHRGSGLQRPDEPAEQSLDVTQAAFVRVQCVVAYGPSEQSVMIGLPPQPLLLPAAVFDPMLPARFSVLPGQVAKPNTVAGPSGLAFGADAVLPPPPT
jgi:hypothetical protein